MNAAANRDFWLSCGHHLLDRDDGGGLVVTDDFLKAYLARPELASPPEACDAERALYAALFADPRRPVTPAEIARISDADARENWQVMAAFRDLLVDRRTIEAAYLDVMRRGASFRTSSSISSFTSSCATRSTTAAIRLCCAPPRRSSGPTHDPA